MTIQIAQNPKRIALYHNGFIYMAQQEENSISVIKTKNIRGFAGSISSYNQYESNLLLGEALIEFIEEFFPEIKLNKEIKKQLLKI